MASQLGYLMIGIAGPRLKQHEREWLAHPAVAGVILFQRNFESVNQLQSLCADIHSIRQPRLLIGVDHEGGRVQRFTREFTRLPPIAALGELYAKDTREGLVTAEQLGWLAATELLSCAIDLSFAPVLDIDYGHNQVISHRAFAASGYEVSELALAFHQGMQRAGMAAVAKHFPGHGYVSVDTHLGVAEDSRSYLSIEQQDMQPFVALVNAGVSAIMPAHVIYSDCDAEPAGFSHFWLQRVLRERLGFEGAIISDDLGMQAAVAKGSLIERVALALEAGCDLVLVCNDLTEIPKLLDQASDKAQDPLSQLRLIRLHGRKGVGRFDKLKLNSDWQAAQHSLQSMQTKLASF
ncbi:beta-N-acetylhexosaminidase [Thiomicrospira sp. ALE5]|uniref:beta-N-acetylhexosaminidase n=1 Tax=Thiomicrospira sp. ALE5 TaxID=748650 RepID=UPI00190E9F1F|nr:beta-N-acetylhexosaminidase [Thiomicrospira sp. ALE5]